MQTQQDERLDIHNVLAEVVTVVETIPPSTHSL